MIAVLLPLATAAAAEPAAGGGASGLILPVIMVAVFYLLLIRPQQRRTKAQQALVASIDVGDRVITAGGVHATVVSVDEDTMRLEVAPGTVMTFARSAVARKVVDADTASNGDSADGSAEA